MVAFGCIMPRCSKNIYRLFDTKSDPMAPLAFGLRSLINTLESPWGGYPFFLRFPEGIGHSTSTWPIKSMLGPPRALSDHPVPLAVLLRSLKTAQGRPKAGPRPLKIAPRPAQDRSRASNFYSPRPQGADQHLGISLGMVPFFL